MRKTLRKIIIFLICLTNVFFISFSCNNKKTVFTIKIIHTNDTHARIESDNQNVIGFDKLADIISDFTKDSDKKLVLDSGDTFHGQSFATLSKGESVASLLKLNEYDAITAGNHDWSYGKDRLKELVTFSGATMLTGNVYDEQTNQPFFETSYLISKLQKGKSFLKIGLFGVIDPLMKDKTTPANVDGLIFKEPIEYSKTMAAFLKDNGCDIVIALSHTYSPSEMAEKVDGVNLWLCGHEHLQINEQGKTPSGNTAYVVESGYYFNSVSLITLTCEKTSKGKTTLKFQNNIVKASETQSYSKNQIIMQNIELLKAENNEILQRKIGVSPLALDGKWENLRINQTSLGNVITDAYLELTKADVAFENAGGIRASIAQGDVTYGDIIDVSPYGNYIVTKKITGRQLKEILETSLDIKLACVTANDSGDWNAWPTNSGSYLQFGGMTVTFNPTNESGCKVISVKVGGEDLDLNKLYTVATNNYCASDNTYQALSRAEEFGQFNACDEAIINFFVKGENAIYESANDVRLIEI